MIPKKSEDQSQSSGPATFQLKVISDPQRQFQGAWKGTVTSDGLELRQDRQEDVRIPVRSKVALVKGSRFVVRMKGRDVTWAVGQMNLYQDRLAGDLVEFLKGKGSAPVLANYVVGWPLLIIAALPAGIGAVALNGGALGGALGGAFMGGLIGGNFTIIRNEKWPLFTRVAISLALTAAGYAILAWVIMALVRPAPANAPNNPGATAPKPGSPPAPSKGATKTSDAPSSSKPNAREISGWGYWEDPQKDCEVEMRGKALVIDVPGTVHNLQLGFDTPSTSAPRVLQPVAGDFATTVRVIGDVRPNDPPAPGSSVAFHGAGLLFWGDAGNFVRLERAAFVRGGQLTTYILFEHHQQGRPMLGQDFPYGGGPVTLRLERQGHQILGSFSPDGHSWQSLAPKTVIAKDAEIGVAAVNTAAAPYRAEFEELHIERR